MSSLRRDQGASWDFAEGAAVMPEQRNHLDSACRLVSLVDDAARRDPGSRGGSGQRLGERNTNQDHHREQRRQCEAHVGDVALERADE